MLLSADALALVGLPAADGVREEAPWEYAPLDLNGLTTSTTAIGSQVVVTTSDQLETRASLHDGNSDDASGKPDFTGFLPVESQASAANEILFVDTRVPDYQDIFERVCVNSATNGSVVYLIEADRDGVAQISDVLAQYRDIAAVHVISHGSSDGLQLGSSWLTSENLDGFARQLNQWGESLTDAADLLIYGCDLVADQQGRALVEAISALTGADVAASTDLTGHATQGGDWALEHRTGQIETTEVVSAQIRETWHGLLAATPEGIERLVNENPLVWDQSTLNATPNAIASDGAGNFIVVWESDGQDGANEGIYARLFGADGLPLPSQPDEFLANTAITDGAQTAPAVAMNADGAYVIVWETQDTDPASDKSEIYARLVDKDGVDWGELRVNTAYMTNDQTDPAVTLRDDGSFVVTWTSKDQDGSREGIYAQRFDAASGTVGGQIQVNNITPEKQLFPSIDSNASGAFAITWTGKDLASNKLTVYVRVFDADGTPQDKQFIADQFDTQDQQYSDVALLDDGSLIVVWQSRNQEDGDNDGIYGRRYDANGDPLGGEFLVNEPGLGLAESAPSVSADAAGNFVVSWTNADNDVYAREFDALGNPVSASNVAVATAATDQFGAGVSMTGLGSYVIVYSGEDSAGAVDDQGVFAKRFQINDPPVVDLNGAGAGVDHGAAFVEDGGPVSVVDAAATITYGAGPNLQKLTVVLTNPLDGADEILSADTSDPSIDASITAIYSNGILTIEGSGTVPTADLAKVLRTVTYENTSQAPNTTDRVIRVLATDDSLLSGLSAYATVAVEALNDTPVITAPGAISTDEDTTLVFTGGGPHEVSIADDAGANDIEVRFDATNGTVTLTSRLGDEFRVNAATPTDQQFPAVAVAADGRYVVVWEQHNGLDEEDIYARTYAADGAAISGDILVNNDTNARQSSADVAIDANGNFVVVWEHDTENVNDKDDVYARTFDIDGVAYGNATRVNQQQDDVQLAPSVAMGPDGYFVVAWQSKTVADGMEINIRPFDIYMNELVGSDILVNTTPASDQTSPDIAIKADGEFVVAWQSKDQDGSGEGIYLRRFDAAGDALDIGETLINATTTDDHQTAPSVAINDSGQAVVTWQSKGQDAPGDSEGIYAQRFDFDTASLVGGEIAVTTETDGHQKAPSVAIGANGNFVVTWQSPDQDNDDGKEGIFVQEFAADGSHLRLETLVNSYTLEEQTGPAIGMAGDSQYVVVWQSEDQDPDGSDGIYGQRFLQPGALEFSLGDGTDDVSSVFRGSITNINAALTELRFTPEADYFGPADLTITVDDLGNTGTGVAATDVHSVAITLDPVNDAPLLQIPAGTQRVAETVPFVFNAFNGAPIALSDADADAGAPPDIELTLSVTHGILTADVAGSGVAVTAGANDSTSMTIRGTQAELNAAIDGLVYTPTTAYLGPDSLNLSVDDQNNFGSGGAQVTAEAIAIDVFDYNVPPVNNFPGTVVAVEDTMFTFAGVNKLEVIDNDATATDDIDVTLTVTHGLLSLPSDPGINVTPGWNTGVSTLALEGDKDLVNAALDGLRFTPDAHFAGTATLQMTTGDQGNSGIDGVKTDQDIITIQVTPDASNDAPTITDPGTIDTTEETPFVLNSVSGNAIQINDDANDQPIRVKVTAADGTVSLSTTVGTQFLANSNTADQQTDVAAAMTPDGSFILVWASNNQDDDGYGIFAQRYDADGNVLDAEFKVNTVFHKHQTDPAVAVADDGSFVVVWVSEDQDGNNKGIFGQRFDASGTRTGAEFQVNTYYNKAQIAPDIATDATGRFVVVWASDDQDGNDYGVYGQVFDAVGAKVGGEFLVNLTTARHQHAPSVAMNHDGDFVVAWQSENAGDNKWDILARRFDANGAAKDVAEIQVSSVSDETQLAPDVAMDNAGDFVVVWQSKDLDYPDGDYGIFHRAFDADGTPRTAKQVLVNTQVVDHQQAPVVAMDGDGDYIVAWQGEKQDDPDHKFGVFAQRYTNDGSELGREFRANTTTVKNQRTPALAAGDDGRFIVAWESDGEDGSGYGIYGQLYKDVAGLTLLQGDGSDDAVVEFEAPLDDVNNVLDGLVFTPAVDFDGATTLTVEIDDLGNSGGPAQTNSAVIAVNVSPVNDAPAFVLPDPQRAYEDVPLVFSTANGNAVSVTDADAGGASITVYLTAYGGKLSLSGTAGLSFLDGGGADDDSMRFSGGLSDINNALQGLVFRASAGFAGAGSIQIGADDGGNDGVGGALTNAGAIVINVESDLVNDAPEVVVPGPQQTAKNVALRLSDLDGNPILIEDDALDSDVRVQLTAVNGTITLSDSLGPETLVNTHVDDEQRFSSIASTPSGNHIVVWQSKDQDAPETEGIYAQRFNPDGRSVGFEFQVNQFTSGNQTAPVVAAAPNGEFAVAWISVGQDGNGEGVFARKFDAYGNPVSDELLVNTSIIGNQTAPAIAMAGNGEFVVVWEGPGDSVDLFLQRFDRNGVAIGDETLVTTTLAGDQELAGVAMDGAGNFVVAWQDADSNGLGIFAQRFDATGAPVGVSGFPVNTAEENGAQELAAVAMNASGQFVIVWQGADADNTGIRASLYASNGSPVSEDFVVNDDEADDQIAPSVAIADDGSFVVAWQCTDAAGQGVYARHFDAAGEPLGGDMAVNQTTVSDQTSPDIAIDASGMPIVTWTSADQDGDKEGVYVQRLLSAGAITWHAGTGDNDAFVDVEGTPEQINGLLNGLVFTPSTNFTGEARLDITVNDQGNSGSGGALITNDSAIIMVDFPQLDLDGDDSSGADGVVYQAYFTPGGSEIAVLDSDFVIATPESDLEWVTLTLTNRPDGAAEWLSVDTSGFLNISDDWDNPPGSNELRISGRDIIANYETVLASVRYHNIALTPDESARQITVQYEDRNGDLSNTAVTTVLIDKQPPVISLSGELDYTEADPAGLIVGSVTIADTDTDYFDGGTLTVDMASSGSLDDRLAIEGQAGGIGEITLSGNEISYNFGGGTGTRIIGTLATAGPYDGLTPIVVNLTSDADTTSVEALIKRVSYENVSDNPATNLRAVRFVLEDGEGGRSETASAIVRVGNLPAVIAAAFESFEYSIGGLAGANGGAGWSGAWQDGIGIDGDGEVAGASVADASGLLYAAGGHGVLVDGVSDPVSYRNLSESLGADGTSVWVGFVLRPDSPASFADDNYGGLVLGGDPEDGTGGLFIGHHWGNVGLDTAGNGAGNFAAGVSAAEDVPLFLTARIDFRPGNDVITLYVNPIPGVAPGASFDPDRVAVKTDLDLGTFNQVALIAGQAAQQSFDEIRIGDSYGNVAPIIAPNSDPVGVPVITGAVAEDQLLSADTSGISDADGLGAFAYQWLRNGFVIAGATSDTYTLGDADVGTLISVEVSYTDAKSMPEGPLTSAQTAAVTNVNDAGSVGVDDTAPAQNQLLTASVSDDDGVSGVINFQWYRDSSAIDGATASTYTTTQADVGAVLTVSADYTDDESSVESLISAGTSAVTNVNDPGSVSIDDTAPAQNQLLTASVSDPDGAGGAIGFQWYRDGAPIGGATASTYTTNQSDVGAVLTVSADYTDDESTVESLISAGTSAVTNVNDAGTVSIDDTTPAQGQLLTASVSDADGASGAISYQWYRDGAPIGGATASTYTTTQADVGAVLSVSADYTDDGLTVESLASADTSAVTNVNDTPVGLPTISGTVVEDQILTTDTSSISDADGLGAFGYQWLRNGSVIGGATGTTYTLGDADVGGLISLEVSYTDGGGLVETVTSAQTTTVVSVNDDPTGIPLIVGVAKQGQVLMADSTPVSDPDGLGAFSFQWLRNGGAIGGATSSGYTLVSSDMGTLISVELRYTDGQGTSELITSEQAGPVGPPNIAPVGVPTISGTAAEDQVLAADASGINDADGLGVFSYQWLRNGSVIGGAVGATYLLGDADVGGLISTEVSYTDGGGVVETVTSAQTVAVTNVNDTPSGLPTVSGTVTEDQILIADTSGISDADGLGAFSYQWLRDGGVIVGATGATFTLGNADVGGQISVEVSYTDGGGLIETVTSAQTTAVTNVNDTPGGLPAVRGTVAENQILSADTSGISDDDGLGAFSYQWLRNGSAISGATGATHTLGDADVGGLISVEVRYTDGGGQVETLTSARTAAVNDINDTAPMIGSGQSFSVAEDAVNGTSIGTVAASDIDTVGTLGGWHIVSGNAAGVFTIDPSSGEIAVANNTNLNYETVADYTLGVQVGDGVNTSATETVTIAVSDRNEAPSGLALSRAWMVDGTDTTGGHHIGDLDASDEDAGATATYHVIGGADAARFSVIGDQLRIDAGIVEAAEQASYDVVIRVVDNDGLTLDVPLKILVLVNSAFDDLAGPPFTLSPSTLPVLELVNLSLPDAPPPSPDVPADADGDDTPTSAEHAATVEASIDDLQDASAGATGEMLAATNNDNDAKPEAAADDMAALRGIILNITESKIVPLDALVAAQQSGGLTDAQLESKTVAQMRGVLDDLRADIELQKRFDTAVVGSVVATSGGLSVGYVVWLIRGGVLASTALSSLPAWSFLDPVPVLARVERNEEDDESLDSIIQRNEEQAAIPSQQGSSPAARTADSGIEK